MITPNLIYWMTRLDTIPTALWWLVAVLAVFALCFFACAANACGELGCSYCKDDKKEYYKRMRVYGFKRAAACLFLIVGVIFVRTLLPTTREMAAIIVIPKIANSEIVAEAGDAAKEMVSLAKAWLAELKPSAPKAMDAEPTEEVGK